MNKSKLLIYNSDFSAVNSHVLCVRINLQSYVIEKNWRKLLAELVSNTTEPSITHEKLWIESLAVPADSDLGKLATSKEMNRPIFNSALGLRATLFIYSCGLVDLTVVADKSVYDKGALLEIIHRLVCPDAVLDVSTAIKPDVLSASDLSLLGVKSDVGVIDTSKSFQGVAGTSDISRLITALGYLLSAYDLYDKLLVAFFQSHFSNDGSLGCRDKYITLNLPINDRDSYESLLAEQMSNDSATLTPTQLLDFKISILLDQNEVCTIPGVINWRYMPCMGTIQPLTFIITREVDDKLSMLLVHDKNVFGTALINRLLGSLSWLLSDSGQESALSLHQSALLTVEEQREIAHLGKSELTNNSPFRLDERIRELAQTQPNRVALCYEATELSYRELDERSNQVAHALIEKGVVKGEHIGICMSRSINTVVAMLGVLKVGAVYVPIDPSYPSERISYTCNDGNLKFIISELVEIPEIVSTQLLSSELFFEACEKKSTAKAEVLDLSIDDAAYIIYTSGSTGKPKGVVIPHKNVSQLINATKSDFELSNEDVWTLFHSTAFDFSVWEIWGCLLTGGRLVIVPYWTSRNVHEFVTLLRTQQVTVLNQTPSAFYSLIKEDEINPVGDKLKLVIFGGEALDTKGLLPWFDRNPETQCRLVNMFGITETTVHVTAQNITRHHAVTSSRSVGRALPGWYIYVLDEDKKMVPPGISGEIYVGGVGVAMHYHGQAKLTAERFVSDPFHSGIMYKSGDKGMMLEDGSLLHLGRLDDQIKLFGFRIELGEIRNVMLSLQGVTAAVVLFSQKDPSDVASARLDTYVVLDGIKIKDVISHAKRYLPDYMQSASYNEVSEILLTPNGKADAKRIAQVIIQPDSSQQKIDKKSGNSLKEMVNKPNDEQIETSIEGQLLDIWQEVLGVSVNTEDNFFDIGGNSLYAIRISSAMKEAGLPAINLRELYMHQTISKLSNMLS